MKRVLTGTFALLVATLLSTANVFARDNVLDYANSIGQVSDGDTMNRVVEATSDGGYIVGGQAAVCIKYKRPIAYVEDFHLLGIDDDEGEVVSMAECEEWYDGWSPKTSSMSFTSKSLIISSDICSSSNVRSVSLSALGDGDEDEGAHPH